MPRRSLGQVVRRLGFLGAFAAAWGCTTIEDTTGIDLGVGYPKEGTVLDNYQPSGVNYAALINDRQETLKVERAAGRGLVHAPELSQYLNDVMQKIVNVAPEKNIPVKVYIRDSEQFQAYARRDGGIFVPIGLLRNVKSEDALAFVLGHELAHVIYQDQESEAWVNAQKYVVSWMSMLRDQTDGKADRDSVKARTALTLYAMMGEAMLILSDDMLNPAWTREQEDQADLMGLDLMIKAGYQPGEVAELFADLEAAEAQLEASGGTPRQRLARLMAEYLGEEGWEDDIASGLVEFSASIREFFGSDHRPTATRVPWLNEYMDTAYADVDDLDFVDRHPVPWTEEGQALAGTVFKGYQTRTMARLLENYENVYNAEVAMTGDKLAEAENFAQKGVAWPTTSATHPRLVFSAIRAKQGKSGLAIENLKIAVSDKEPSVAPYQKLINAYIEEGNFTRALHYAEKAGKDLNEPPQLMPMQISLNVQEGRRKDAEKVLIRCQALYPELGEECRDAMETPPGQPQSAERASSAGTARTQQSEGLLPSLLNTLTESRGAAQ